MRKKSSAFFGRFISYDGEYWYFKQFADVVTTTHTSIQHFRKQRKKEAQDSANEDGQQYIK